MRIVARQQAQQQLVEVHAREQGAVSVGHPHVDLEVAVPLIHLGRDGRARRHAGGERRLQDLEPGGRAPGGGQSLDERLRLTVVGAQALGNHLGGIEARVRGVQQVRNVGIAAHKVGVIELGRQIGRTATGL